MTHTGEKLIAHLGFQWPPEVNLHHLTSRPFPSNKAVPDSDKGAVLSVHACDDATGQIHGTYISLLHDIVFNIEEYKVRVYKYRNRTIFKGNMSQEFIHSLLMVTSKCGEDYAMDLSSAQFRYDHPVDPWESYCINRGYEIKEIYGFGFHAAMCQNSGVKVVAANETIAHAMNDAVAKWENSHSRLSGLLK